jgi:hypothetical protein
MDDIKITFPSKEENLKKDDIQDDSEVQKDTPEGGAEHQENAPEDGPGVQSEAPLPDLDEVRRAIEGTAKPKPESDEPEPRGSSPSDTGELYSHVNSCGFIFQDFSIFLGKLSSKLHDNLCEITNSFVISNAAVERAEGEIREHNNPTGLKRRIKNKTVLLKREVVNKTRSFRGKEPLEPPIDTEKSDLEKKLEDARHKRGQVRIKRMCITDDEIESLQALAIEFGNCAKKIDKGDDVSPDEVFGLFWIFENLLCEISVDIERYMRIGDNGLNKRIMVEFNSFVGGYRDSIDAVREMIAKKDSEQEEDEVVDCENDHQPENGDTSGAEETEEDEQPETEVASEAENDEKNNHPEAGAINEIEDKKKNEQPEIETTDGSRNEIDELFHDLENEGEVVEPEDGTNKGSGIFNPITYNSTTRKPVYPPMRAVPGQNPGGENEPVLPSLEDEEEAREEVFSDPNANVVMDSPFLVGNDGEVDAEEESVMGSDLCLEGEDDETRAKKERDTERRNREERCNELCLSLFKELSLQFGRRVIALEDEIKGHNDKHRTLDRSLEQLRGDIGELEKAIATGKLGTLGRAWNKLGFSFRKIFEAFIELFSGSRMSKEKLEKEEEKETQMKAQRKLTEAITEKGKLAAVLRGNQRTWSKIATTIDESSMSLDLLTPSWKLFKGAIANQDAFQEFREEEEWRDKINEARFLFGDKSADPAEKASEPTEEAEVA